MKINIYTFFMLLAMSSYASKPQVLLSTVQSNTDFEGYENANLN